VTKPLDTDLTKLCIRALKKARPFLLGARGPRAESKRVGMTIDEALAELGEPQDEADWD
jgi:hypothetical protein